MDDGLNDGWKPPTAGLNDPAAVRSLRIDDVVATYVVDGVLVVRPAELLPKVPAEHWSGNEGLLDGHARMVMSVGSLLIERDGRALLIDAGAGPTSGRTVVGPVHSGAMLDVLGRSRTTTRGHRRAGLHAPPLRPHGLGLHPRRRWSGHEDVSECPLPGVGAGMGTLRARRGCCLRRNVARPHQAARGMPHRVRRRRRGLSRRTGGGDARTHPRPHVLCHHLGERGAARRLRRCLPHPRSDDASGLAVRLRSRRARGTRARACGCSTSSPSPTRSASRATSAISRSGGYRRAGPDRFGSPLPTRVHAPAPRTFI